MTHQTERIIHTYYQAWANRDQDASRAVMADDMTHRSSFGKFSTADDFLQQCWMLGDGMKGVSLVKSVFTGDKAFVILDWDSNAGHYFGAEYLAVEDGKITEIVVVNTDSEALTKTLG